MCRHLRERFGGLGLYSRLPRPAISQCRGNTFACRCHVENRASGYSRAIWRSIGVRTASQPNGRLRGDDSAWELGAPSGGGGRRLSMVPRIYVDIPRPRKSRETGGGRDPGSGGTEGTPPIATTGVSTRGTMPICAVKGRMQTRERRTVACVLSFEQIGRVSGVLVCAWALMYCHGRSWISCSQSRVLRSARSRSAQQTLAYLPSWDTRI